MKLLLITVLSLFMNACALGPIINHDTGRSVGKNKYKFRVAGYPQADSPNVASLRFDTGVTENLDVGFQYEILSFGLRGFYSFINNKEGFAMSGSLGYGSVFNGNYINAGLNFSFKSGSVEYFAGYRHTDVSVDATELTDSNTGELFTTIPSANYSYGIASGGLKYWFTDQAALGLEGAQFMNPSDGEFSSNTLVSLGFEYIF